MDNKRSDAMEKQIGGTHYNKHMGLQPWDIIDEYDLNYYEGNILKYLLREKSDRIEDLGKLIHYAEKELENLGKYPDETEQIDDPPIDLRDRVYKTLDTFGITKYSVNIKITGHIELVPTMDGLEVPLIFANYLDFHSFIASRYKEKHDLELHDPLDESLVHDKHSAAIKDYPKGFSREIEIRELLRNTAYYLLNYNYSDGTIMIGNSYNISEQIIFNNYEEFKVWYNNET